MKFLVEQSVISYCISNNRTQPLYILYTSSEAIARVIYCCLDFIKMSGILLIRLQSLLLSKPFCHDFVNMLLYLSLGDINEIWSFVYTDFILYHLRDILPHGIRQYKPHRIAT